MSDPAQPENAVGDLKAEVAAGLEILKKRWKLKTRYEVMRELINKVDPTVLQIAQRQARLKGRKKAE